MAYSGLETLFQNLGPTTASMVAGQREADAKDTQDLANQFQLAQTQAELQKSQQLQKMNPLLLAHQGLLNQGLDAGLPGITADSRMKVANATFKEGTLATDITAGNSKNKTQLIEDAYKASDAMEKMGKTAAARILPGPQAEASKAQVLTELPDGAFKTWLSGIDAQKVQEAVSHISRAHAENTDAYIKDLDVAKEHSSSAEKVAQTHLQGVKYTADSAAATAKTKLEANSGGDRLYQNWLKSPPETRFSTTKMMLDTGINAFTHEPLTRQELAGLKSSYESDVRAIDAKRAAMVAGKVDAAATTKLPSVQIPSVGAGAKPPTSGVTTSGTKFKVVETK